MPDNQVEIVFRSIAELQGALATQAELEKTRGKLLTLGKDTLEVDAQLARANALVAQAPPEMLDAAKLQEQASGFEHLNLKGREFHRVLHEISAASPEAGLALRAFISPATAGFFALLLAVKGAHDKFKEFLENLKIGGEWKSFSEALKDTGKGFDDASLAADGYWRSLNATSDATKGLARETDLALGLLKQKARQEDEERSATLAQEKAKIDAREKAGAIDAVTAIQERAAVEDKFAKEKVEREAALGRAVLERKQKEKTELIAGAPAEEKATREAQRAFALAEKPEDVRKRIEAAQANVKAAEAEQKKAEEAGAPVARRRAAAATTEAARETLRKETETGYARIDEFNQLREEMQAREAALKARRARLEALSAELEKLIYATESDIASRGRVSKTESETRQIGVAGESAGAVRKAEPQIAAAAEEATGLMAPGGVSKAEAVAQSIEDKGLRGNREAILQVIERFSGIANGMDAANQELFQLVIQRLSDIERRVGNLRTNQN